MLKLLKEYDITSKLLILTFVISSYAAILPVSYIDDILILFIGLIEIAKVLKRRNMKVEKSISIILMLLVFESVYLVSSLLYNEYYFESLFSYFVLFKMIIILILSMNCRRIKVDIIKIQQLLYILSIPNIICGLYQYIFTYILKGYIPGGKYELTHGYRLQGFTGHPIYFSLLLLMLVLYLLFYSKSRFRLIVASLCIFMCLYTWTSFSSVLLIILLICYIFKKCSLLKRYIKQVVIFGIIGASIFLIVSMNSESYTIRSISMNETFSNISFVNFLIGEGFGSFENNGLGEAYFFHLLYENGVLGIILFAIPIYKITRAMFIEKNYAGMFFVASFLLNNIINEGYLIPYILYMPFLCLVRNNKG